jgi:hypothetical protein
MEPDNPRVDQSRRTALKAAIASLGAVTIAGGGYLLVRDLNRDELADAADAAALDKQTWTTDDLDRFLQVLPLTALWNIRISLGLSQASDPVPSTLDRSTTIAEIKKQAHWVSSSIATYPFTQLDYDPLVRWAADQFDVAPARIRGLTTFKVEQELMLQVFAGVWDRLSPEQRAEVLRKVDPDRTLADPGAMVLMSGSVAAATLATTALFAGFGFYVAMSTFLSSTAGLLGLTLPWAAYSGASSAVAFLATNPFGWAIIATGILASIAWLGSANEQKSAAFVCQINALRAAAWRADGRQVP